MLPDRNPRVILIFWIAAIGAFVLFVGNIAGMLWAALRGMLG